MKKGMNKVKPNPNPRFKKLVVEYAQKHAWNMGLSHYKMDVVYTSEDEDCESGKIAAMMNTQRRYLACELVIMPLLEKMWKENGNHVLSEVIAHEIAHVATAHMRDMTLATYKEEGENKDSWETLTEVIGRMSVAIDKLESKKKK